MGRALRHRDYALYEFFGWFSNLGLWVQRVGIFWLTWELTGSGAMLGALALAESTPIFLLVPITGTIADRFDRLRVARTTQLCAMAVAGVMAALFFLDLINIPVLFILVMLSGVVHAFWAPVRLSITPSLVPPEDFSVSVGVDATLFNVAQFVGPAIAGLIIAFLGIGWTFAFNTVSFLAYLVALGYIRLRPREQKPGHRAGFLDDIGEGARYLTRHRAIGPLFLILLAMAIFIRPYVDLLAGLADQTFGRGSDGYATLASAVGLGGFLAALWIANFVRIQGLTLRVLRIMFAVGALTLLFATVGEFWVVAICSAAIAFTISASSISSQILIQTALDERVRGRVMSLWMVLTRAVPALGAQIIGGLSDIWGFQRPFFVSALLFLCAVLFIYQYRHHLARHLETPPGGAG